MANPFTRMETDAVTELADAAAILLTMQPTEIDEASRTAHGVAAPGQDHTAAHDGTSEPQRRPLTARERDLLCRVISDITTSLRGGGAALVARTIRLEPDDLLHLDSIKRAIDPREP